VWTALAILGVLIVAGLAVVALLLLAIRVWLTRWDDWLPK